MHRSWGTFAVSLALTLLSMGPATAQGAPQEISGLRRRIAAIRAELPAITAVAEDVADRLGRNPQSRLLVSKSWNASFASEMTYHGGGVWDVQDADAPAARGIVLLPVRSWRGDALRASIVAEQQATKGRYTIVIGPDDLPPALKIGQQHLSSGPPDSTISGGEAGLANAVVAWTLVAEMVAAASRDGWHPGVLLSAVAPGFEAVNNGISWRNNDTIAGHRIPAGQLGTAYLDELDRILVAAGSSQRVTAVERAATALKSVIERGGKVYMASCMQWLSEELPRDSRARGAVRGFDWRWDTEKILGNLTTPADAVVWFGYGGTDCPHSQPSGVFRRLKRATVVVAGPETAKPEPDFLWIPQAWRLPDAAAPLPFSPGRIGPVADIEAGITWLWLKRLLAQP